MTDYLCKDCKHSKMDLLDKIFTLGGRVGVDDVIYNCSKFPKKEIIVESMVIGPKKIKAKLPYCESVRLNGECGPNAKHWAPKKKKDLFKMLTKEQHD